MKKLLFPNFLATSAAINPCYYNFFYILNMKENSVINEKIKNTHKCECFSKYYLPDSQVSVGAAFHVKLVPSLTTIILPCSSVLKSLVPAARKLFKAAA